MHSNGWVSTREAATRALVSRETIRNWIALGRLQGKEYANHTWVSLESLDKITATIAEVAK